MDSKALCDLCDTLNFDAAGFVGPDLNYDLVQFNKTLTLERVFRNSRQCFFCRKIANFFNDWWLPEHALDLENSHAYICSDYLKSLEVDSQGVPKGRLIYIDVTLIVPKPPPSTGAFRRSLRFRKCNRKPLKVTEACNRESLFHWEARGQERHEAYSGRIRPLDADFRLFRMWKECCYAKHGDHCSSITSGSRPRRIRLINVKERRVVDNKDGGRYVALSYVWGKVPLPTLTIETLPQFRQVGSLNLEMLPSTIDDAIEVTKSLGEDYLWIDSLCIVQNDPADKRKFIPQMDLIYGFASVTIFALAGANAGAGLPGTKPNSRTREQLPFTIKGVSLLATLDPEGSGDYVEVTDSHLRLQPYTGESVWNTRGWTFQERIFSRRALIFTKEQVYWECQKASWCEDGLWETIESPTIYRHSFAVKDFRHPWGEDVDSFQRVYRKLVEEYSARDLTKQSDGLNAFEGIVSHFQRQDGQRFLWALPAWFLSTALTWACTPWATRRTSEDSPNDSPCLFPSWSWVGWVGQVFYAEWPGHQNVEDVGLVFYYLDDKGMPTNAAVQAGLSTRTSSRFSIWMDHSRTVVTRKDIPKSVFSLSLAPIVLCFYSSAATLLVQNKAHLDDDDQPSLSHNGKLVPCSWLHLPLTDRRRQEFGEFVCIGPDNFVSWYKNRMALLFVSWKDGVAYRRGLVTINSSDWVELDNRVWKMITLC